MTENANARDSELIDRLGRILNETDPVPADVSEFAKAAFDWRNIDGELASMEFDSSTEDVPSGVRSTATARMISFEAGEWTIDLEHREDRGAFGAAQLEDAELKLEPTAGVAEWRAKEPVAVG